MDSEDRALKRRRRLALIAGGSLDMLIGAGMVLIGLGLVPVKPTDLGLPTWIMLLLGAVLAFAGVGVAFYNFSRLDE